MSTRLEACYFGAHLGGTWERLARVLRATATQHCAGWQVRVAAIAPTPISDRLGNRAAVSNTQKLDYWRSVVRAAEDGDRVLLIDADTMITRPLDDVWDRPFDIAYTTRPAWYPLNGGVLFVRISAATKRFMETWADENLHMLKTPDHHQPWRRRFAGINQASFGYLLTEHRPADVTFLELPCAEWNCEDTTWAAFAPAVTRIVHIKSALRVACLESQPIPPELVGLADRWRSVDREALRLMRSA